MKIVMKKENGLSERKLEPHEMLNYVPSFEALDWALNMAEDYLSRSQIPFLLSGETLESIVKNDQIAGSKVELMAQKRNLTKAGLSMLRETTGGFEQTDSKLVFTVKEVPVEIKIIKRKYKILENPDVLFYKISEYKIPNPLERYWKVKGLFR